MWKVPGERASNWYEHRPEGVIENDEVKILWDFMIQCDRMVEYRKPDIVVVEKKERRCLVIDVAVPGDIRIEEKENEKVEKYQELKQEIIKLWEMKKVDVIPIVVGALGAVSRRIRDWISRTGLKVRVEHLQKTALLGTARILRRHLSL